MFDWLRNLFNKSRYRTNSEACIVACFYNPQNNPYRLIAFQKWYRSIKHLNHRIIECLIGPDAKPQLPDSPYITRVPTESLLWHKETLINKVVKELPEQFKYVFLLDADVLFTNQNWMLEGVEALQEASVIQPFEYCVHLGQNQSEPDFDVDAHRGSASDPKLRHKMLWRSFCANFVTEGGAQGRSSDKNYDVHGHVGFAWGFRREVLEQCPLYDRALVGGADHIIAHAAAGQIPHNCIDFGFSDNLPEVQAWSKAFYAAVRGRIGYVEGDLYHIWHGDIAKRQYLKRIKGFTGETKEIVDRDQHGLHVSKRDKYIKQYYREREVEEIEEQGFYSFYDDSFYEDMGYHIADIFQLFGPPMHHNPMFYDEPPAEPVSPDLTPFDHGGGGGSSTPMPVDIPFHQGGSGVSGAPMDIDIPFDQGGAGRSATPIEVPFEAGGAGTSAPSSAIITDEQLARALPDAPAPTPEAPNLGGGWDQWELPAEIPAPAAEAPSSENYS